VIDWTKRTVATAALLVAVIAQSAPSAAAPCEPELTAKIPPRAAGAPTGTAFTRSVEDLPADAREAAIVAEILRGNIPSFLRTLVPVAMRRGLDSAREGAVAATLCVMPDYLAVGSDADFLHMPMNLHSATKIARELGFVLPTVKIVDAIHAEAAYAFSPQPLAPGPQMILPQYFLAHENRIRAQGQQAGTPIGALVAGHKKDIVLSNVLDRRRGRLAIYGWHYRDGTPIQPLSTAHHAGYVDYSHGIRLVSQVVTIDRQRYSVYDVLEDDRRAELLSGEGAIHNARALMGAGSRAASGL
jgi:hypothetical protein